MCNIGELRSKIIKRRCVVIFKTYLQLYWVRSFEWLQQICNEA